MIRVTSGEAKNKKLVIPNIPNIRVAQDIVKQAMFSIIGNRIDNSTCLDLYAGSGSFGIEAISRGAQWCDFVDENRNAKDAILENLRLCKFDDRADVILADAVKYVASTARKYDLIFIDPFYEDVTHKYLMKNTENTLKDGGLIVFTHGKNLEIKKIIEGTTLKINTERRFGMSYITVLEKI